MANIKFKGEEFSNNSLFTRFKINSNLTKSKDKFNENANERRILKSTNNISNNDILKKSYLSTKSKIDYTSEDILRQLNSLNQNVYDKDKLISYPSLIHIPLSDLQKFDSKTDKVENLENMFNINDNNLSSNLSSNSLLKSKITENLNSNFNKFLSNNSLLNKSSKKEKISDKFHTNNISLNLNNYIDDKQQISKLLDKLDFHKYTDKILQEEKINQTIKMTINSTGISNLFQIDNKKENLSNVINPYNKFNEIILKQTKQADYSAEKMQEEYHTFSKPKENVESVSKKMSFHKHDRYLMAQDNLLEKNKSNLESELQQKKNEINLLKNNFKKKIELIEQENEKNINNMEKNFNNILNNVENLFISERLKNEDKDKNSYNSFQYLISKLKLEWVDLKNNSVNISKHEEIIRELRKQLTDQNIQTSSIYNKVLKELLDYFDRPEYLNLIENMRFYMNYRDKLNLSNLDMEKKFEYFSIREYDLWIDKIKLNLIKAESKYLDGMIELETKFNNFIHESNQEETQKFAKLEAEINAKFLVC